MNPAIIEALEREDYKSLPEPVFVTGYIRKYANLVGLDPKPLVATYGAPPVRARTNYTTMRTGRRRIDTSHLALGLIGVGSLLLVGVLVFLWQWYQRPDPVSETTAAEELARETVPADVLDRVPESELSAFPADPEDPLADRERGQSPEPGSDPETSQPQPPITTTATTATWEVPEENAAAGVIAAMDAQPAGTTVDAEEAEATTAAAAGEIEVVFTGPCWVDVRDSAQKSMISGAMKEGDRYVLEGKPPYSFVLGNATAVQVTVGGKPLDLNTVSRGSVARFTLDADGKVR